MPNPHLFLLALSFYTRVPIPAGAKLDYAKLPEASVYLPLVGWLVGAVAGLCFYVAAQWWNPAAAVILSLTGSLLLTGAFHEDGFADVCDGFGGGYGKERILDIMKDSRIGAYGAIGLILLIGLKISLLSSLPTGIVPFTLLAGHSLSRFAPLYLMYRYDYARREASKSSASVYSPSMKEISFAGVCALLPLMSLPVSTFLALPAIILIICCLGRYFQRMIGGYTGDCLGACQQTAEAVFYLAASALWTSS
ncbi:MAG: adenosylcobinamide-GDP ribazoletransferase [Gammaproteobacteria bacterium]|nr:adenosylcobinamide-GDP ribazoletransferase [Gammaproteobacteria bacterium]